MNYVKKKADEIWRVFGDGNADKEWIEQKIKEVIKDVRHKAAENVAAFNEREKYLYDNAMSSQLTNEIHNAVMNTQMD
jgi:hypothetical protein